MARFSRTQIEGMDLNLFFYLNSIPVHVATMGTVIPSVLNDTTRIAENWQLVKEMPYSSQYRLNRIYLDQTAVVSGYEYLSDERSGYTGDIYNTFPSMDGFSEDVPLPVKLYSWSFVDMSRRGFYSFAPKEGENNEANGIVSFILISKPTVPLATEIQNIKEFHLPNFNVDSNIIETEGIELFEIIKHL